MSDEGSFAVHRSVFRHALFEGEEYSRLGAWTWLLGHAVWKTTKVRIEGRIVTLERGQLSYSLRFLATKWRWSKDRVARFMDTLKTETMIAVDVRHGMSLITICNYNDYQFNSDSKRDATETVNETPARRQRDKEEEPNKVIIKDHIHSGDEKASRETKSRKASKVPLPENWQPPVRSRAIALRLGVDLADQEERFRDYLASHGVEYANYDSAFCNFVKNALKFNGVRGPPRQSQQPSYQDIASTLGARANAANESGYSSDPCPGTKPSLLELVQPNREPGYRRAGS